MGTAPVQTGGDEGTLGLEITPYFEYLVDLWKAHPVIIFLAGYGAWSYLIYRIARKADVDHSYLAFIPVFQNITLAEAGGRSFWWGLWTHLPVFGFLVNGYIGMGIAEQRDESRWLGALCGVPGVNMVILGYFAFIDPSLPENAPAWAEDSRPLSSRDSPRLPEGLLPGRAACRRCGRAYEVSDRAWSEAGCCSRACARRAEAIASDS